ncbi:MAG: SAM-dependent methyltransferase, partial [Treponema sp.]|nr:SAM-dependent methyltransferase [Treponema sp.]
MILSATLSKPTGQVEALLGKKYERVKIRFKGGTDKPYFAEFFTDKQSFHKNFSEGELEEFLSANVGPAFKNCVERTEDKEITFLTNKKGKTSRLEKPLNLSSDKEKFVKPLSAAAARDFSQGHNGGAFNRSKNYIIKEGSPVPFLQALGVMTDAGKVVAAKYDKFRQINRFVELLDDVLPAVLQAQEGGAPLQILDFGSGKSYLTFAVQYFLERVKKIPCQITGVDLKKDVVDSCADLARRLGISNMNFVCGDIASYAGKSPDIVITLHACDTATDYALAFAVEQKAKAILSVPCCQREINSQLRKDSNKEFAALLKHGILRERFSALMTDAVRAELLEERGYNVQVLEFIDMEGTPKNLMIRATLKDGQGGASLACDKSSPSAAQSQ